jgi:hypothetical protein
MDFTQLTLNIVIYLYLHLKLVKEGAVFSVLLLLLLEKKTASGFPEAYRHGRQLILEDLLLTRYQW